MSVRPRLGSFVPAFLALALLSSAAAAQLRIHSPVYKSKVAKTGAVQYSPLKAKDGFDVVVRLYRLDGQDLVPFLDDQGANWDEVLSFSIAGKTGVTPGSPGSPGSGDFVEPTTVSGALDLIIGSSKQLPADLDTGSAFFTTQVTAFGKSAVTYEESPAQLVGSSLIGLPGPQGLQGPQGPQGIEGIAGPQGPQGIQGVPGADGADGTNGVDGTAGADGGVGSVGPVGPQGDTGATGAQGPIGPQGPLGPVGSQGAIGPQGDTGVQGPQGVAGPIGPAGATGATGATGSIGPQGLTGPQGSLGPKGDKGDNGSAGASGSQGPPGLVGPAGAPGAIGPAGPKGDAGAQGAAGPQGDTGTAGATGPSGPAGAQGAPGDPGPTGSVGPQGVQGAKGDKGTDGPHTGGLNNSSSGAESFIGGGEDNGSYGTHSTVGGGFANIGLGFRSFIGGGGSNAANGLGSMVVGGDLNTAGGIYSFAAGRGAQALDDGAFVWGDSQTSVTKGSSAADEFNVYASGGARIFSNATATAGVVLAPGGGSWSSVSDRAAKENIQPVDPRAVLQKVCALPIATWNYIQQSDGVRHMGPMAQDFRAAFGLGVSDKMIDTIDPDGVALAAIQGLNAVVRDRDAEIAELKARQASLERKLDELARRVEGGTSER